PRAGDPSPAPRPPAASRTALQSSVQNVLDRRVLKRQICIHALELGVFRLALAQTLQRRTVYACVLRLPVVIRRRADPVLAHDFGHWYAGFPLLQNRNDLRFGVLGLLHRPALRSGKSLARSVYN